MLSELTDANSNHRGPLFSGGHRPEWCNRWAIALKSLRQGHFGSAARRSLQYLQRLYDYVRGYECMEVNCPTQEPRYWMLRRSCLRRSPCRSEDIAFASEDDRIRAVATTIRHNNLIPETATDARD